MNLACECYSRDIAFEFSFRETANWTVAAMIRVGNPKAERGKEEVLLLQGLYNPILGTLTKPYVVEAQGENPVACLLTHSHTSHRFSPLVLVIAARILSGPNVTSCMVDEVERCPLQESLLIPLPDSRCSFGGKPQKFQPINAFYFLGEVIAASVSTVDEYDDTEIDRHPLGSRLFSVSRASGERTLVEIKDILP